ncbi:zinc ribbon domain-containing protein [Virgibacillus ihumii]|uniref:zinc ribbon domain-containing protein n=1 Tax=Virgibacillus ihumii TaxID=2686091 RepID=UPI001FEC6E0E|nr:zinc ribbon domain-containing protein [Virgibacillus ihumii]
MRLENKKEFNKFWYIPIAIVVLVVLSTGSYYVFMQNQIADAKNLYKKAEEVAMEGHFNKAKQLLNESLKNSKNFAQADLALSYVQKGIDIKSNLAEAENLMKQQEFQQALSIINDAEDSIMNYEGAAVTELINTLTAKRNAIKIEQLKYKLGHDPSISELKTLVWEAESIKTEEADKITNKIRNQIIDYTYSKASKQLNAKQFSDASIIVEEGLKYAPESEKLQSLKTTIDKEKIAFETTQRQRIEQAISTAEKERKFNQNKAVELVSVSLDNNQQGNLIVKGKVKSNATVPINTILVEYSLLTKDENAFSSNEVYVYPDTLYPDETGKFEFTHYDIDQKDREIKVQVDQINWYTD